MQKVEGSSPFSRSHKSPAQAWLFDAFTAPAPDGGSRRYHWAL